MEEAERLQKQRELIETIGIQMEREGHQPAASRILAMLMVLDKQEFTFEEIVEEMKMSKSSVSVGLRELETRELAEYVTFPGDRKRYFRLAFRDSDQLLAEMEKKMRKNIDIANQVLQLKKDPSCRSALFFKHILEAMEFFHDKLQELKEIYKKQHGV